MNSLTLDRRQIYAQYKTLLLDNVVPFWLNHGIDWKYGGVLSCIRDDGSVISGDKFLWSQARSVWTFAALYNRVEKRLEFLAAAENSIRFLLEHGRDQQGRWIYHADQQGREIEGPTSIYTDCFVIYGFSEYYRAVRDQQLLSIARETL